MKVALITGVTGQDGAYLSKFLLDKGYDVHGIRRRSSLSNTSRLKEIIKAPQDEKNFHMHYGDLSDSSNLIRLMQEIEPDEIYNLGAQSHVKVSFDSPEYTADVVGLGTLRVLESIRIAKLESKTKFYQASTSELFGLIQEPIQSETTPFYPRSPYAAAKMYAYWITVNYREAYGIYACNGILFNHESPLRGDTFVTRKITSAIARIVLGNQDTLYMGNINAERDWGHAKDYVEMQWLMLQQETPKDYVIATGIKHSVREFIEKTFEYCGVQIKWKGIGIDEIGIVDSINNSIFIKKASDTFKIETGQTVVKIDPYYFRPTEVEVLLGNPAKAKEELGWTSKRSFEELVNEMIESDLSKAKRDLLLHSGGFDKIFTDEEDN
jgi:GDPmannose 4,6-dehydratase